MLRPANAHELAHHKLDEAVLDAYGWPHGLGDEEVLTQLLALNLERAAAHRRASPVDRWRL